jgi:hypothetical protein
MAILGDQGQKNRERTKCESRRRELEGDDETPPPPNTHIKKT